MGLVSGSVLGASTGLSTLGQYSGEAQANAQAVIGLCDLSLGLSPSQKARCDLYVIVYNRSANSFELMLDATAARFESDKANSISGYFRYTIEEVAVRIALHKKLYQKLQESNGSGGIVARALDLNQVIGKTQRDLMRALKALAGVYRTGKPEEQRHIIASLREMQWLRFDELKSISTSASAIN